MRAKHWLLLILLSILWGGTYVFAREALTELPPLTVTFARCAIGAAVLVPVALLLRYPVPATGEAWRNFGVMALLNNVIPFGLTFWAQTMIPAGLASVMNATTPLMTLLVARFVAGEKMPKHKVAGLLLGLAGVAILIGPSALTGDHGNALGMLLVVGCAVSYGFSGLWGRRFNDTPPIVTAAAQLACATIVLLPMAAAADQFWRLPLPPMNVLVALLALGTVSTALAYILFFKVMAEAGSNNVMLVTLLIPISAVALGVWRFGERLSDNQMAGAAIIAASLLLIDGRVFGVSAVPQTGARSQTG